MPSNPPEREPLSRRKGQKRGVCTAGSALRFCGSGFWGLSYLLHKHRQVSLAQVSSLVWLCPRRESCCLPEGTQLTPIRNEKGPTAQLCRSVHSGLHVVLFVMLPCCWQTGTANREGVRGRTPSCNLCGLCHSEWKANLTQTQFMA